MAVPPQEPGRGNPTDQYPLLTERPSGNNVNNDHVIHIHRRSDASSSNLSDYDGHRAQNPSDREDRDRSNTRVPDSQSSSSSPPENSSSSSVARRNEESDRRHWSPLNSGFWISIELVFTLSQITAAVIVVLLSRHEKPRAPLFLWIEGYTAGCVASLPLLYWRYVHRNLGAEQRTSQPNQDVPQGNSVGDQSSYINISVDQASEQEDRVNTSTAAANGQTRRATSPRLILLVDHLKMALDCFFAIWFVLGNVWIFGGHSSASDAPNLYRLCIVYLTLSGIGYAMPFILCAMICCCLPCIISMLGIREEHNQIRGATEDSINALPAHKFKLKKNENEEGAEEEEETSSDGPEEGGIVAAGTEKERVISSEDAVCCICLARYVDDDELRELPCSHFFHAECVDKWLRINATCPLCKCEIGEKNAEPPPSTSQSNSSEQA